MIEKVKSQSTVASFFEKKAESIHVSVVGEAKTVSRSGGVYQELVSIGHVEKTDR